MLPTSWCCFVINLERSPARLNAIAGRLDRAGIAFRRFEAFDGREIDPDGTPLFDRKAYEARHGKLPSAGEIGCFMSHIGVMRAFLASDAEHCLVLEDDAIFEPQFTRLFDGLQRSASEWDVVLLYGNHPGAPQPLARIDERHRLVGFFTRQTGAVAYAVNRKAAQIYVDRLLPMTLPIDIDFDRAWDFGIKFRGVLPFPVHTGTHPSDIGQLGSKFPWFLRWRTYGARAFTEAQRLIHYSIFDPIWIRALWFRSENALARFSYSSIPGSNHLARAASMESEIAKPLRGVP